MEKQEMVFGGPPTRQRKFLRKTFEDTFSQLGMTTETHLERARAYFRHYDNGFNEMEIAARTTQHLVSEMDFDVFVTAMKIMGVEVSIKLNFLPNPDSAVSSVEVQPHPKPDMDKSFDVSLKSEAGKAATQTLLDTHVNELDMPVRVKNVLIANNVLTYGGLTKRTEEEVYRFVNMGTIGMAQLKKAMYAKGLSFAAPEGEKVKPLTHPDFDLTIAYLGLEMGIDNVLKAEGILLVGQLIATGENGIRALPGIGSTRMNRIIKALEQRKLYFGMSIAGWQPPA